MDNKKIILAVLILISLILTSPLLFSYIYEQDLPFPCTPYPICDRCFCSDTQFIQYLDSYIAANQQLIKNMDIDSYPNDGYVYVFGDSAKIMNYSGNKNFIFGYAEVQNITLQKANMIFNKFAVDIDPPDISIGESSYTIYLTPADAETLLLYNVVTDKFRTDKFYDAYKKENLDVLQAEAAKIGKDVAEDYLYHKWHREYRTQFTEADARSAKYAFARFSGKMELLELKIGKLKESTSQAKTKFGAAIVKDKKTGCIKLSKADFILLPEDKFQDVTVEDIENSLIITDRKGNIVAEKGLNMKVEADQFLIDGITEGQIYYVELTLHDKTAYSTVRNITPGDIYVC